MLRYIVALFYLMLGLLPRVSLAEDPAESQARLGFSQYTPKIAPEIVSPPEERLGTNKTPASGKSIEPWGSVCAAISVAAIRHRLPPGFLKRLIWQESRFNPRALSRAGAQGIAQFMPATAQWRGLEDPFNPQTSIDEAARWLSELRGQLGNLGLAAAAYNAGPKRIQDWLDGKQTLPEETKAYVRIVTGRVVETWALPGVRDDNTLLSEPSDCQQPDHLKLALYPTRTKPTLKKPVKTLPTWSLQLVGDQSEQKALAEFKSLQKKFPKILKTRKPVIVKRQLGGRRPAFWYQVRVTEASREKASTLCSKLRNAGGECLVLRSAL